MNCIPASELITAYSDTDLMYDFFWPEAGNKCFVFSIWFGCGTLCYIRESAKIVWEYIMLCNMTF